jgi:hypothetical protein
VDATWHGTTSQHDRRDSGRSHHDRSRRCRADGDASPRDTVVAPARPSSHRAAGGDGVDGQPSLRVPHRGHRLRHPDRQWGGDGPLDARKATLLDVIEDTGAKSFEYLYDFGDGWEHSIKIERIAPAVEGIAYPRLLEASGRCPPEDVGGPWKYQEARQALIDPSHARHEEIVEWWDADTLDPHFVNIPAIEAELAKLARRWIRKPRAKK